MKPLIIIAFLTLLLVHFASAQKNKMPGSYKMLKQTAKSATADTTFTNDQFKIYTDRHFMFVIKHTEDSLCEYGIGTYQVKGDSVVENAIDWSFPGVVSENQNIALGISNLPKGYRQAITFRDSAGQPYLLTEDYEAVGKKVKSPMDGAWKQTRNVSYSNNDSTVVDIKQYKIYHSGNFIWTGTLKDSASNKPFTVFGYGSFRMDGKNKLIEVNQNSTFNTMLVGIPMEVKFEMLGPDTFRQTITSADGHRGVETWERLK